MLCLHNKQNSGIIERSEVYLVSDSYFIRRKGVYRLAETFTQIALVTGASRGIGRGTAWVLAEQGYDMAITHLEGERADAEAVAERIRSEYGRSCVVLQGDLTDESTPARFVDETVAAYGRLDVLVNNAGLSKFEPIQSLTLDVTDYTYKLNFRAPLLAMQAAARHMIDQSIAGRMINITSSRAERAYPGDGVYGGLKAALARATQSIALDLAAYGIRVNCVAPGATIVREPRGEYYERFGHKIPLTRMGETSDVGQAVAWLASEQSSYVTGVNLRVDGGLILPGMPEDISPESGYGWSRKRG